MEDTTEVQDVAAPDRVANSGAPICSAVPETQESFDSEFSTSLMDATDIAQEIDDHMGVLRKEAGDFVRSLFMRHGYFNGRVEGTVRHQESEERIECELTVSCYGLPCLPNGLQAAAKGVTDYLESEPDCCPSVRLWGLIKHLQVALETK